jgi:hypothetical protein
MLPVVAAVVTFLLLAGAGIVWAIRRDGTRRASGKWLGGSGVDDSGIAYAGSTDGCDLGGGGSADCGGGGD